jgi:hypothetical protein
MTWQAIPRTLRSMYLHAWQSWLWNLAASERVRSVRSDDESCAAGSPQCLCCLGRWDLTCLLQAAGVERAFWPRGAADHQRSNTILVDCSTLFLLAVLKPALAWAVPVCALVSVSVQSCAPHPLIQLTTIARCQAAATAQPPIHALMWLSHALSLKTLVDLLAAV